VLLCPIDRTRWYVTAGEMRFKAFATDERFPMVASGRTAGDYTASRRSQNPIFLIRGDRLAISKLEVAPLGWKAMAVPPTDALIKISRIDQLLIDATKSKTVAPICWSARAAQTFSEPALSYALLEESLDWVAKPGNLSLAMNASKIWQVL